MKMGVPSSETEHTDPRSSELKTQRWLTHLKTNSICVPESFIHLVFLPRNELGINSTFLQTKILSKIYKLKEKKFLQESLGQKYIKYLVNS